MSSKLIVDSGKSIDRRPTRSRAFTLIEILVVLGIITLVAALGVPVFNALSGARSTEAGRNVVAAALGQARTIAVNEGRYAGVMFYVDPATERTAMSIVIVNDPRSSLEDADPYDKYKSWISPNTPGLNGAVTYRAPTIGATTNQTVRGDRVIAFSSDFDSTYKATEYTRNPRMSEYLRLFGNYRPVVKTFRCKETHTATDRRNLRPARNGPLVTLGQKYQTAPTLQASGPGVAPESSTVAFSNQFWGLSTEKDIATYYTGEQQLLPKGVGVQVIVQPLTRPDLPAPTPPYSVNATERYVRTGVIMFDPQGRQVFRNYSLAKSTTLGTFLELASDASNIASGLGVVLYDQQTFKAQPGFSESDWVYQGPPLSNPYAVSSALPAFENTAGPAGEVAEETWLDNNTVPLLINRFSGSMSEAE